MRRFAYLAGNLHVHAVLCSEHAFRKFINAAKFYEGYRATVQGETEEVETEAELKRLLNRIGAQGAYSKVMSEEEYQVVESEPSALDNLFHELARKRLAGWVDFAETRLKGTGVKCYITGGNDDYPDTLVPLQLEDLESVVGCEGKEVQVADSRQRIRRKYFARRTCDPQRQQNRALPVDFRLEIIPKAAELLEIEL